VCYRAKCRASRSNQFGDIAVLDFSGHCMTEIMEPVFVFIMTDIICALKLWR